MATYAMNFIAMLLCIFCMMVSCNAHIATVSYTTSYLMDKCGGEICTTEYGKIAASHGKYDIYTNCVVTLDSYILGGKRLYLELLTIDLCKKGTWGHLDSLTIYDGMYHTSKLDEITHYLNAPGKRYTSSGRYMTLYFHTEVNCASALHNIAGPTFRYTRFYTGNCSSSDFSCKNGRCISGNLKCDSYDNCGDNSDEELSGDYCMSSTYTQSASSGIIAGVVVTTLLVFVLLAAMLIRHRHRNQTVIRMQRMSNTEETNNTTTIVTSGTNPGIYQLPSSGINNPAYATSPISVGDGPLPRAQTVNMSLPK